MAKKNFKYTEQYESSIYRYEDEDELGVWDKEIIDLNDDGFDRHLYANSDALVDAIESEDNGDKYNKILDALLQGVKVNESHIIMSAYHRNEFIQRRRNDILYEQRTPYRLLRSRASDVKIHILDLWQMLLYSGYSPDERGDIILSLPESCIILPSDEYKRECVKDVLRGMSLDYFYMDEE